ncbi:ribonuclease domain-containing protein [Polaromonas sp. YR568]|uniref:ribonuclease domain-containing protein n=1 Tax=Polaromonas sp. YR568 TaxID=1855301 RepID=UPI00398BDB12
MRIYKLIKASVLVIGLLGLGGNAIARFMQADPIGLEGGINQYGYVDADPLNYVDPDGLTKDDPNSKLKPQTIAPIPTAGNSGGGGGIKSAGGAFKPIPFPPPFIGAGNKSVLKNPVCPPEVMNTMARINAGQSYPHRNDGSVFGNKEQLLPIKPAGYYREYVHPTPGSSGPGAQRVVTGQGGEAYYSPDHYGTFIPIPK